MKAGIRQGLKCLWLTVTCYGDSLTFRPDVSNIPTGLSTCCALSVSARVENRVNVLSQTDEWRRVGRNANASGGIERTGESTVIDQFAWYQTW